MDYTFPILLSLFYLVSSSSVPSIKDLIYIPKLFIYVILRSLHDVHEMNAYRAVLVYLSLHLSVRMIQP
jgi:hypothetical protein